MNFSKKAISLAGILLIALQSLPAQVRQTREEYIDRYKSIAVAHMERYGIPASITMAQGILESDCGNSWLSLQSNNHFGIKCKRNWTGDKVYYDDDAKGECFRSYPSVEASYRDHAEFLDSQPRYDSLFAYSSDDYKSWARGLKAAGYATAPDYAQRLTRIIEENQLYLLDRPDGERLYASRMGRKVTDPEGWFADQSSVEPVSGSSSAIDPDNYRVTINAHNGYNVYQTNGVHYVLAKEGDTFENIGQKFRISARNLRKFNDLKDKKAQPMTDEVVYIERKKKRWEGNAHTHICRQGETAYAVGQSYAIRTRSIEKLNRLKPGSTLEKGHQIRIKEKQHSMETTPLRSKILDTIIRKSTLKQRVFDNTFAAFNELKETLLEMASEMDDELDGKLDRRVRLEYRDRGKFEAQLQVANDILIFQMHTDVFEFDANHLIWQNPYVQSDRENSYCGLINIYNFLSDSFKFNRNADEGYLIGRIFINRERRYFVEGKQQTSMRAMNFGKAEIDREALIAILEPAIWFALNFDLLMPPYEDNKRVTVDPFNTKMDNSKFVTGKRLGYDFEVEDI